MAPEGLSEGRGAMSGGGEAGREPAGDSYEYHATFWAAEEDKSQVTDLVEHLKARGLKIFFTEDSLDWGEPIVTGFDDAVERGRSCVLFWSEHTGRDGGLERAHRLIASIDPTNRGRRLRVVKLDASDMGANLKQYRYLDASRAGGLRALWAEIAEALGAEQPSSGPERSQGGSQGDEQAPGPTAEPPSESSPPEPAPSPQPTMEQLSEAQIPDLNPRLLAGLAATITLLLVCCWALMA